MDKHGVMEFLSALGAQQAKVTGEWVQCSCLFAHWTHAKGTDRHPSFGISIHENSPSRGVCYTCGETHLLYDLVLSLRARERMNPSGTPRDWGLAMEIALSDEEPEVPEVDEDLSYEEASVGVGTVFADFPKTWLSSFPRMYSHPYLTARGIPVWVAEALDVRYDFQKQRICFPYWDFNQRLAGMQGRDVTGQSDLRYLSYRYGGKLNQHIWMGENHVKLDEPVVLTEGPVDYAKIRIVTDNVLASMTSALGHSKLSRIADAYMLITAYDYGTGGDKARKTLHKRFPDKLIVDLIPDEKTGDFGAMESSAIEEWLEPYLTN